MSERPSRRVVGLETVSVSAPLAAAVGASCSFLTSASDATTGVATAATAVTVMVGWVFYRRHFPPVGASVQLDEHAAEVEPSVRADGDERWRDRLVGILLAGAVGVAVVVGAVVSRLLLPLFVVTAFATSTSSSELGDYVSAIGWTAGVGLCIELLLVAPLRRRLTLDTDPPPSLAVLGDQSRSTD